MNKSDVKLVLILLLISLIIIVPLVATNNKNEKEINIFYKGNIIKNIKLPLRDSKEYIVDGELGEVIIEVKNNMVRIKKENSPNNICSKQGWISKSHESLVCLPNKIVVEINAISSDEIDAIVK